MYHFIYYWYNKETILKFRLRLNSISFAKSSNFGNMNNQNHSWILRTFKNIVTNIRENKSKLKNIMEICKIVSENWTYIWYISYVMTFGMLYTLAKAIFRKTQLWAKKSRFYVQTLKILVLKFSELIRDTTKIFFANEYLGLELLSDQDWCVLHV